MRSFYGCYLLRSLDPAARIKTYIGFTVNPRRRIRQHNGEITSGAWRTRRGRPWEMVLVVYGFPTQVHALQFEWAWQHPKKSKVAREVLAAIKTSHRNGVQGKVRLLLGMLNASPWRYYPLTLQFLAQDCSVLPRGCLGFPDSLDVLVAPMDSLPTSLHDNSADEAEDEAEAAAEAEGKSASDSSSSVSENDADSSSSDVEAAEVDLVSTQQQQQQQEQEQSLSIQQETLECLGSSSELGGNSSGRRRRRRLSGSSGSSDVVLVSDSEGDTEPPPLQQRLQPPKQQPPSSSYERTLQDGSNGVTQKAAAAAAAAEVADDTSKPATRKGRGKKAKAAAAAAAGEDETAAAAGPVRCGCCQKSLDAFVLCCSSCSAEFHTHCLANAFRAQQQQQQQVGGSSSSQPPPLLPQDGSSGSSVLNRRRLPAQGNCPSCGARLVWLDVLAAMKRFGGSSGSNGAAAGGRKGRRRGKAAASGGESGGEGGGAAAGGSKGCKKGAAKGGRRNKQQATAKTAAAAADAAAPVVRSKRGKAAAGAGRQLRGAAAGARVVGAAAVKAASDTELTQPAAAAAVDGQQRALQDLLQHLQQQYPHLQLPSDLQALQQLLWQQQTGQDVKVEIADRLPQQQQRRQVPGVEGLEADHMDLCSDEADFGQQHQQQLLQQQQQQGGPWYQQFFAEQEQREQQEQQQQEQQEQREQEQQQQQQQQDATEEVDLCSSPEPLFQRLRLASPVKGKRARGAGQPAAAVADRVGTSAADGGSGEHGSSDGGSSGSGRSSPRRLAVRCRPNGSTPAAMVIRSRARQLVSVAAVIDGESAAAAGGVLSDIDVMPVARQQYRPGAAAAADGVVRPELHRALDSDGKQQEQLETICLLDSD